MGCAESVQPSGFAVRKAPRQFIRQFAPASPRTTSSRQAQTQASTTMRAYYVVLAAVATLLAIGDASAATSVGQTQLSGAVSPDSANAVEAAQTNNQRFLRKRKTDVQDEERGGDTIKSFKYIMKGLEGKNMEKAFAHLQFLKLPLAQREAILKLHLARLAKAAQNAA